MRDAAIDTHRSTARGAVRSRTSGAPPLDDMVGEGPVSRAAPRRGGITSAAVAAQRLGGGRSPAAGARGRRNPGLATRLRARLPRIKPLKALTVAAFVVALVGIVANAMVFQRGHHPSPLFGLGRSIDGTSDAPPKVAAAAPTPAQPAAAERTGTVTPPAPATPADAVAPAVAPAPKAVPVHHAAKPKPLVTGAVHPRPGHPGSAIHAKAEAPAGSRIDAKPAPKAAARPADGSAAGSDPVTKLLAEAARPKRAEPKAAPASKAASRPAKAASSSHPPHHRVAASAPVEGAKPAAKVE